MTSCSPSSVACRSEVRSTFEATDTKSSQLLSPCTGILSDSHIATKDHYGAYLKTTSSHADWPRWTSLSGFHCFCDTSHDLMDALGSGSTCCAQRGCHPDIGTPSRRFSDSSNVCTTTTAMQRNVLVDTLLWRCQHCLQHHMLSQDPNNTREATVSWTSPRSMTTKGWAGLWCLLCHLDEAAVEPACQQCAHLPPSHQNAPLRVTQVNARQKL